MEVMGVFSSWVTALMKPSCCSLRRISRTRKIVFRIIPAMIAAKKITPKNSSTPSRQFRMVQPTVRAMARATREQPSTTKKAIVFLRLAICTVSNQDCTAKKRARATHGRRGNGLKERQANQKLTRNRSAKGGDNLRAHNPPGLQAHYPVFRVSRAPASSRYNPG